MNEEFKLSICPLTNLKISKRIAWRQRFQNPQGIAYRVIYDNEEKFIRLCPSLYKMLTGTEDRDYMDEVSKLNEALPFFYGNLSRTNFEELWDKTIHWDCRKQGHERPEKHLHIKPISETEKEKGEYPKTIKEKTNLLLKIIKNEQKQDGEKIEIIGNIKYSSKVYLRNSDELKFYLYQLAKKDLIEIEGNSVNLTFDGIEYVEGLWNIEKMDINKGNEMYQIGLSFAGEQRDYVKKVADALESLGISVFYDGYEKVNFWGKDLYQHLNDVYKNKCEYCIIFISKEYAKKIWAKHELASAQTRAFKENKEYILPVKFDSTEIPGLNDTIGYLDANKESPIQIAQLAKSKLEEFGKADKRKTGR